MTGFLTATLNCDGSIEGLGESRYCPGWFDDQERSTVAQVRKDAKAYGWTRDGPLDFCSHHSSVRAARKSQDSGA